MLQAYTLNLQACWTYLGARIRGGCGLYGHPWKLGLVIQMLSVSPGIMMAPC
jgi:hypothetical protein